MKIILKKIGYISIIPVVIGLLFFENIKGYYSFKQLCKQEKHLVVKSKLERGVGWQLDFDKPTSRDYALQIAGLPHIKFVRFKDGDRKIYDVYYIGKTKKVADGGAARNGNWKDAYELQPANFEKSTVYLWQSFEEDLPSELRTSRAGYRFTDLRTKEEVVSFTQLGFSLFDRNHTLLDAPSGEVCGEVGKIWEQKIQSQIFDQ